MMRGEEEYSRRSEASMVNPEIYSVVGSIRHKMFIIISKGTQELDDMISNKWHSDMYFLRDVCGEMILYRGDSAGPIP